MPIKNLPAIIEYSFGDQLLPITLHKAKVKHLRLSVSDLNVKLTLPGGATDLEIRKFLKSANSWLIAASNLINDQNKLKTMLPQCPNATYTIWGAPKLAPSSSKLLVNLLETEILERVKKASFEIEKVVGLPEAIKIRRARTQWGCLTGAKNMHLNPAIAFVPEAVCDYIIIHEFAHLMHANHKRRFWQLVAKFNPDHKKSEVWLKKHFGLLSHVYAAWGKWKKDQW